MTFIERLPVPGHKRKDNLHTTEVLKPRDELFDYHFTLLPLREPQELSDQLFTKIDAVNRSGIKTPIRKEVINRAKEIATDAHETQKRRYSGADYLVHPLRVALLTIELAQAMGVPVTEELIAGAILHDTIEDSKKKDAYGKPKHTKKSLRKDFREFGYKTARAIAADSEALNHNTTLDENGEVNSQKYYDKIHSRKNRTFLRRQIIKAGDRWDNLLDPPQTQQPFPQDTQKLEENRKNIINRTRDTSKVTQLLLKSQPFLLAVVTKAANISELSVTHPDFDFHKWGNFKNVSEVPIFP